MTVELILGDCLEVMQGLDDNSVDTIITDPPYGLEFMGKAWDKGVPGIPFWAEMLRVAKPGACLMAMGGTRTYHRLASAIEDAGWRIIDMIEWLYGSGFPKSYDIGKGMDKAQGAEREVLSSYEREGRSAGIMGNKVQITRDITAPATPEAQQWDGWGTALKPAHESILLAHKPIEPRTVMWYYVVRIIHHIAEVAKCQLKSSAIIAELSSKLSQAVQGEASGTAQWNVVNSITIPEDLHVLMGTLRSELGTITSWNIVLSWLNTLVELCELTSTFTTETVTNLTIDLRTLNSLPLGDIFQIITHPSGTNHDGLMSSALIAESLFNVVRLKLNDILTHSAQENATSRDGEPDLHPNLTPICVAYKPRDGTYVENALKWGVAGLWIDGGRVGFVDNADYQESTQKNRHADFNSNNGIRVPTKGIYHGDNRPPENYEPPKQGRFPANVIHDGSDEVLRGFPETKSGNVSPGTMRGIASNHNVAYADIAAGTELIGYGDSGSAARFFKACHPDDICPLCLMPKRGIMKANHYTKDISCDANTAIKSSSQTEKDSGFVESPAQERIQPENGGKNHKSNTSVSTAEKSSWNTSQTKENIAQLNVQGLPQEKLVQRVKCAGNLCEKCATAIAQSIVAMQQGQSLDSILGKVFISEHKKQILIQNLAPIVEVLENTDTIPTIPMLKMLFGSVQHAIENTTAERIMESCQPRFLYQSKASRSERNAGLDGMEEKPKRRFASGGRTKVDGEWVETHSKPVPMKNGHPTVKPIALMEYLVRLTKTPTGGVVLDPFMGSGTTGIACVNEGRDFIGIEQNEEYLEIARRRIEYWQSQMQPRLL